ncbi:MAG TPA: AMP-binding protein, partial [Mycobacterium sp.]|nr:AMP-binding protein [Mycobacterium sp.]
MSADTREERLARRIAGLYSTDQQFAAAKPSEAVAAAIEKLGLPLVEIMRTVMQGYQDRPALGQRAVEFVTDPHSARSTAKLLPQFETITYGELWNRVGALTSALSNVRPGDRVCILGFTSVDYTVIDMATVPLGAVSVPLQTSAPITQLRPIVTETQPAVIASSIDYVDAAVELVLTGDAPRTLIVFDYRHEIDEQREAYDAARARLTEAASPVFVETLAEALERGRALLAAPEATQDNDALALLIYTSGSTGAPKGAIYTQSMASKLWRPASWGWADSVEPSITLSFMPMSHVMGRSSLYGTLAHGGTAYFAARSDLSTFQEDLALVRPTQLNFVPRVWDMLFQEAQSELDRRSSDGADVASDAEVVTDVRTRLLGNRYITAITGGAPASRVLRAWVELFLDLHLIDGYGSTEAGGVFLDGQLRRPPVIDYKLVDVPELGYFHTDRPHPRGELLLKTTNMFPG